MKKIMSILLVLMLAMNLTACTLSDNAVSDTQTAAANRITFEPGTYEGIGRGNNGEIKVKVTVTEDAITLMDVIEHQETAGISDPALEQIPDAIVQYQSLGVDAVSGATRTSEGLLEAAAAALEQAGADVAALRAVPVNKEVVAAEDMTTQVVVAGSGISGMMAAATAANEGAEVILVEKLGITGGSAGTAAGGAATVESELIPAEMDDGLDRIMAYTRLMNETSERQPDYEFLATILGQTGITVDYIAAELGVEPEEFEDRGDYVRSRYGSGRRLIDGLADKLAENGGVIMLNTKAEEIVMDGNKAIGLKVSGEGGEFTIYADKVIIATGGASGNMERLLAADPQLANVALRNIASAGNTGDGFQMLEDIGAKMGDGPYPKSAMAGFSSLRARTSITNLMLFDADGERFCNESPMFQTMTSSFLIRHGSTAYYALLSEAQADEETLTALKEAAVGDDPQAVVYGATIEELAEKLQIPAEKLRATFDRYQELCATGEDSDFGKPTDNLIAYAETGGYYAAHVQASAWGTFGGAITDEQFRVRHEGGSVISNVFAVGECANSEFFGDYYQGAFSLGLYSTAGRIAAQAAVTEINSGQ